MLAELLHHAFNIMSTACGPSQASCSPEWVQPFLFQDHRDRQSLFHSCCQCICCDVMFSCLTFLAWALFQDMQLTARLPAIIYSSTAVSSLPTVSFVPPRSLLCIFSSLLQIYLSFLPSLLSSNTAPQKSSPCSIDSLYSSPPINLLSQ